MGTRSAVHIHASHAVYNVLQPWTAREIAYMTQKFRGCFCIPPHSKDPDSLVREKGLNASCHIVAKMLQLVLVSVTMRPLLHKMATCLCLARSALKSPINVLFKMVKGRQWMCDTEGIMSTRY